MIAIKPYQILHFGTQNGLSFGKVNSIVQDKNGFIWVATDDGLNRFDGISFKTFKFDEENNQSLAGNYVQRIFRDVDGKIWVSSRKGLTSINLENETFVQPNSVKFDVSHIIDDKKGNLWVSTTLNGIYKINKKDKKVINYNQNGLKNLSSNSILTVKPDSHGLVWIGTNRNGINILSDSFEKLSLIKVKGQELLKDSRINAIFEDSFQNIWIAASNGIFYFKRTKNEIVKLNFSTKTNTNIFLSVLETHDKTLMLGIQDGGLYKLNLRAEYSPNTNIDIQEVTDEKRSLSNKSVQSLYEDRDFNVWVGTYGDGIYMLGKPQERFEKYGETTKFNSIETSIKYYGITEDNEGFLWLGTDGNGIFKTTLDGKIVKRYAVENGKLTDNAILSAYKDSRNTLWFGSYKGGLYRYNKKTDSFENYKYTPNSPDGLPANDVRTILEDSQKNLWIGLNGGGLSKFNPENKTFTNFNPRQKNFISSDVRAIVQEKQDELWIGTYGNGLFKFYPSKNKFVAYLDKELNLSLGVILSLHIDVRQVLWIGTQENGLISYNLKTKEIKKYNERRGLLSNTILSIKSIGTENLWISTNAGLSKIEIATDRIYNFDTKDGLQKGVFNENSVIYNAQKGYMCYGGTGGWNFFYPEKINQLSYKPHLVILGIDLFGNSQRIQNNYISIQHLNKEIPKVTLESNQSVFAIQYRAINFSFADENKFAYMLEGLDKDWLYVNKQKAAIYRYLQPGTYIFKVKVANKDDIWFDDDAQLMLVILPPWYKTWWAYLIYTFALMGVVYYYQRYRNQQAALRYEIEIAKIESEKEKEINERKIAFFTYISHEFRTPLTLIINPLKDIVNHKNKDFGSLGIAYRNARRLLSLVDQLLLFRKSESGLDELNMTKLNLNELCKEVYLCFVNQAKDKNIFYEYVCENEDIEFWGDKEKLEIALFNLISNALKFTNEGGDVSFICEQRQNQITIKVKDSGVGIAKETGEQLFQVFYQGRSTKSSQGFGIGLYLAKTYINKHGGNISYVSSEKGTEFTIKLHKNKDLSFPIEIPKVDDSTDNLILEELNHNTQILEVETLEENFGRIANSIFSHPKTMVIIDDDIQIRNYLKQLFCDQFNLLDADNGQTGLALVEEHLPDIIICDVFMQGVDGIEVCSALKQNDYTKHIPIILLTASSSLEIKLQGIELGVDDFISKPFEKELLIARVNSILRNRNVLQKYFFNEVTLQSNTQKISPEFKQFIDDCIKIVEKNLLEKDFNVGSLASELCISPSSLYTRIKSVSGLTPNVFIRYIRLRKAAVILISTKQTISQVSYEVGFKDIKYFREQFTKLFGITPSAYLKKYRKPFQNKE
ncbi:hybrid sensor histidine kinase/response regulator transcription factor [Arcicella aurantiaca]|nr:hybrid sensor histidine kinase/response regulator transcription factor [Arcicella aurantiaca]